MPKRGEYQYHDEAHAKHREEQRRYRRRKKFGGVVPKFEIREDEFFKLAPRNPGSKHNGYRRIFEFAGIGHQSMAQLRRGHYLRRSTRQKICEYLGVSHSQLFRRVN